MEIIVKVILVYLMIVSIAMLLQGSKKETIVTHEISRQLDSVLKDKEYAYHLEYLQNRDKEIKSIASNSFAIHKIK